MHVNRGLLGWGVFFVVAGAVPLLVQSGAIDPAVVRNVWQLWPLILIGIGLGLILQRTRAAIVGGLVVSVTFGLLVGGWFAVGWSGIGGFGACGINGSGSGGDPFPTQSGAFAARGARGPEPELRRHDRDLGPGQRVDREPAPPTAASRRRSPPARTSRSSRRTTRASTSGTRRPGRWRCRPGSPSAST